jgi:FAD/FMN-containing dehydrogenase
MRTAFPRFQYPMVGRFPYWNRKFAPHGFNEVQALFPVARFTEGFRALRAVYRKHDRIPEMCAVRRHRADAYPLAFAGDGLSVTFPFALAGFSSAGLDAFRREIVDAILRHDGKVYLSKFPYLTPDAFRRMYPGEAAFRAVKARVDPATRFWSDTAARLLA